MKMTHEFPAEHGFTGSHHTSKEHRPHIPGYKRGDGVKEEVTSAVHQHEDAMHGGHHTPVKLKEGGMPSAHKKNYKHGASIHDSHPKNDGKHHTDKHGFQHYRGHGHKHHGRGD